MALQSVSDPREDGESQSHRHKYLTLFRQKANAAKQFFKNSGVSVSKVIGSLESTAFVRDGVGWCDELTAWVQEGLFGTTDLVAWRGLYDRLDSLMIRLNTHHAANAAVQATADQIPHDDGDNFAINPKAQPAFRVDIEDRRAFWNGKPLNINQHADVVILDKLWREVGNKVAYLDLLHSLKPNVLSHAVKAEKIAPQEVRDAISHIRAAFKKVRCPYVIHNVRQDGYRLSHGTQSTHRCHE